MRFRIIIAIALTALVVLPYSCTQQGHKITQEDIILSVVNRMPDFRQYLTVEELNSFSKEITKQFPKLLTLNTVGESAEGTPIYEIQLGKGTNHILLFGFGLPHEAGGSMMLVYLLRELTINELLRNSFDFTWHIVLCVDPDGAKLNEGWFKEPMSLTNFVRKFYLPAPTAQVEWAFPIEHNGYIFDKPLPGTKALMKIIDNYPIVATMGFHSVLFGEAFYTMSKEIPSINEKFNTILQFQGFPLEEKPQDIYRKPLSGSIGFYSPPSFAELNSTSDEKNGKHAMQVGGSLWDYVSLKWPESVVAASHLPRFSDPSTSSSEPASDSVKSNLAQAKKDYERRVNLVSNEFEKIKPFLKGDSPFKATVESLLNMKEYKPLQAAQVSAGEVTASTIDYYVNSSIVLSQYLRLLESEKEGDASTRDGVITESLSLVEKEFKNVSDQLESAIHYTVMPIQRLGRVQLLSTLYLMEHIQSHNQEK